MNALLTYFFYQKEFSDSIATSDTHISQLFNTVRNSASVAAYLDNQELANEVTQGLSDNDIVAGVELSSQTGMHIISGDVSAVDDNKSIQFSLSSPFLPDEHAGRVIIHPNHVLIEESARKAAISQAITITAHSTVIVILVIFLVNVRLTNPLKQLIVALHQIVPGSDTRLDCPKRNKDDEIGLLVMDINQLLRATQNTIDGERRLREYMETLERRFRLIFEKASSGIVLINDKGKIILHNPSFEQMIPKTLFDKLDSIPFEDLFADRSKVYDALKKAPLQVAPVTLDLQIISDDETLWLHALMSSVIDEHGNQLTECILYDISERAQRELQTKQEAERDPLTQVLNRRGGEKRIDEALEEGKISNNKCALLLIDLDKFKPINDTYGHDAGDKVLVTVSKRLNNVLRKTDTVIRWGGDEFLILVQQVNDELDPHAVCEKLLESLKLSIDIGDRDVQIGASIGVSIFPDHSNDRDELIELADKAMYQVKQKGRDGYNIAFSESENTASVTSLEQSPAKKSAL